MVVAGERVCDSALAVVADGESFDVILLAVVYGLRYWRFASTHASTDDAQLASDVIQISPQVSGTVAQVLVRENQVVKAGDVLVISISSLSES